MNLHLIDCNPGNCETMHAMNFDASLPDLGCNRLDFDTATDLDAQDQDDADNIIFEDTHTDEDEAFYCSHILTRQYDEDEADREDTEYAYQDYFGNWVNV